MLRALTENVETIEFVIDFTETAEYFKNLLSDYNDPNDEVLIEASKEMRQHILILGAAIRIKTPMSELVRGKISNIPKEFYAGKRRAERLLDRFLIMETGEKDTSYFTKSELESISEFLEYCEVARKVKLETVRSIG